MWLYLVIWWQLASYIWLGHSEVVPSFASCSRFFYQGTPPNNVLEPNNPAMICQRYRNQYRFATLYDRDSRIPIYSAYIYQPGNTPKPRAWMIEPQLVGSTYSGDVETEKDFLRNYPLMEAALKQSQAVVDDYNKLIGFTRGHLSPSGHHSTYSSKQTTFSLTNIVPQDAKFNNGVWQIYESRTMSQMTKGCTTTYVITGAVPSNSQSPKPRVNTPTHIWSAACCPAENKAWGVIAENNSKSQVQIVSLGDVENRLAALYGKGKVSLFHPDCPR